MVQAASSTASERSDPGAPPPAFAATLPLAPVGFAAPTGASRYWHRSHLTAELWRSADVAVAFAALIAVFLGTNAHYVNNGLEQFLTVRLTPVNLLLLCGFVLTWPMIFSAYGLYEPERLRKPRAEVLHIAAACATISATTLALLLTGGGNAFAPITILLFFGATLAGTLATRHTVRFLLSSPGAAYPRRILIVGSGPRASRLFHHLLSNPQRDHEVVGFVDTATGPAEVSEQVARKTIGTLDDLERILLEHTVDEVLIALPIRSCYQEIQQTIRVCERVGLESHYLADVFQCSLARAEYHQSATGPVVSLKVVQDDLRLIVKRGIDVVGAAAGLALLSPLLLLIAIAIKLTSPGPVFFTQHRYGYNRRRFPMYKFRTMVANAESLQISLEHLNEAGGPVFKIKQDPRVTPVGRFLRRTSLDELPQLVNILRGQMSLVGPRPLPPRDVGHFKEAWLMRRFSVLPGLTCLWQISGRSNLGFDDWVNLDLAYIDHWSLRLDFQILLRTIPAVVRGTGAT